MRSPVMALVYPAIGSSLFSGEKDESNSQSQMVRLVGTWLHAQLPTYSTLRLRDILWTSGWEDLKGIALVGDEDLELKKTQLFMVEGPRI